MTNGRLTQSAFSPFVIWIDGSASILADLVIELTRQQPANTEHVHSGANDAAAETIFALAESAWAMIHRQFDQTVAGSFYQGGNKAVHSFERHQGANTLAPHRF